MNKYSWLTLPTVLSLSRIFLLPFLVWLVHSPWPVGFLLLYLLVGSTDFFDGLLARRLNQVTPAGKEFDAVADVFFYLASAYFLHVLYPQIISDNTVYFYIFFVLLFFSLAAPVIMFRKLVIMHTLLLKLGAVLVYLLVIVSFIFETTIFTRLLLILYSVAFIEEIIIYLLYGDVNPDTPSLFSLRANSSE